MVSRRLVSALGGRQGDLRLRAATWLVAALFLGSGTVLAEPQPASDIGKSDGRTYLKQDGGKWFEVRKGPAGLEQRLSAAPRAAAVAAPVPQVAGPPSGLFEPYTTIATGSWPEAVAIGDVTGDGRNDVALVTSYYFDVRATTTSSSSSRSSLTARSPHPSSTPRPGPTTAARRRRWRSET